VEVEVEHRLARACAAVRDDAEISQSLQSGHFLTREQASPDEGFVVGFQAPYIDDGSLRDDQHVGRRDGVDVAKRQDVLVFQYDVCVDLFSDDLGEDRIHGASIRG